MSASSSSPASSSAPSPGVPGEGTPHAASAPRTGSGEAGEIAEAGGVAEAAGEPGERVFLLVLVAFSALALWQSYRISGLASASGAGVFPMLASGAMLLASSRLLVRSRGSARGVPDGRGTSDGRGARATLRWLLPARTLVFVALAGAFVALVPWLGFLPTAGAFLLAALLLNWRRGPLASLLVTLALLAVIWVVFRELFRVVLPTGTLWRDLL